ncbi:MAG: VCBS repeat-containing protein [Flavisolibacter sp.]
MKKKANDIFNSLGNVCLLLFAFLITTCSPAKKKIAHPLFEVLDSGRTGLDFTNKLSYNREFNLFKYIYFYNGSGIGAGDFNNDGLTDLFFGANQGDDKLFLNTGGLKFRDVTKEADIPQDGGWSTGISVVDINNDGLLDIYVCRVGQYEILHSRNQLLINMGIGKDGVPRFVDQAKQYGLDFSGFSTQAAFLDYDNDGDLDMFLLNHSVHENGTFRPRKEFNNTYHPLSGDRIFRNDGNHFTDVTKETGINSTAIGYGLGIAVADINLDGYPDIYIGNDFHENDYLYINQKNGTFRESGSDMMMHTSQFSMGVDVADVNNDAFPEIISMDMLPSDPYILKRSLGEDTYDIFHFKISVGYMHQYTRNNLQFNRGDGLFSETGLYSGVAATDWSWAPLWMDFDNDGLKDLFISNGIPKRMNDIDYINFVSNGEVQQKIRSNNMKEKDMSLIEKFPEIRLPNKFFRNTGNLSFHDEDSLVQGNVATFSNGAIYADLDNDGDLDVVVNNIDMPALVYENRNVHSDSTSLQIHLKGPPNNINAVGAKAIVYSKGITHTYEKFPARGFMSSMEIPIHIGTKNIAIDSILIIWPDRSYKTLHSPFSNRDITVSYNTGLSEFNFERLRTIESPAFKTKDITQSSGIDFLHRENHFVEFDREPLQPRMLSTEGPALAIADINDDGREDIFLGNARNAPSSIYLQGTSGKFIHTSQPDLEMDSVDEDVAACWVDVNRDGYIDLIVASGGNEFYGNDPHNSPRVYLNNGKADFKKLDHAFENLYLTASTITPCDFNNDGYQDIFIGSNAVPWEYGKVPRSYLLQNDGSGRFKDVTEAVAPGLATAGFVNQASWYDLDGDGDQDLLLAMDWNNISAFINNKGKFTLLKLADEKGWWNFLLPCDVDGDGDVDLIAGNLGLNNRLKASLNEPVQLYYNDFDGNGKKEQVLTYYVGGKEIPFASKAELEKQMPVLKKKFLLAKDFASSSLKELFGADELKNAVVLSADYFSNTVFINDGHLHFTAKALPWKAQLTSYRCATIVDANSDGKPDIFLGGNFYENNMEMGRYDADYGMLLINDGKGAFTSQTVKNLEVKGQVRHIGKIFINHKEAYILARNNDSCVILSQFAPRDQLP